MPTEKRLRICPLCEATCGLELSLDGHEIQRIRGDREDVFSRGFICPKGTALDQLHADSDRLHEPLLRRHGSFVAVSWDEAFAEIDRRLSPILADAGRDAVAVYLGNPVVHNISLTLYAQAFLRILQTGNLYTASTVDQIPKQLAVGLMFGTFLTIPVPDIDRSDYLLILGADPCVSNGSLWTVPDFPGRLAELRKRGGRCVVVDPRRSRTAEKADRHIFIRPGGDALLLAAIAHTLFAEGLVSLGRLAQHTRGVAELEPALKRFSPETVEAACGVPGTTIRELARELANAQRAVVYGRIGTCTQTFGAVTSWLIDVCNVLTGNLDRPGGAMFPKAAAFASNTLGEPGVGRGVRTGRRHSRVRGAAEVQGEFPVACLAEEIETPGDGQVRALITIAGNPALSTPNSSRLQKAFEQLEFMLSLDIYVNETTRHADVILPGLSPLEESHFDAAFNQLVCRNNVRYSRPVFDPPPSQPYEWETLLRLAGIVMGQGPTADIDALDALVIATQVQAAVRSKASPLHARDPAEILAALEKRRGPERLIDFALRSGPYGDGFGTQPDALSLGRLESQPHGIDLGPLQPRIPEVLRTPSGKIELAPEPLLSDLDRLADSLGSAAAAHGFTLVGRRNLRTNNSWMHNMPGLMTGKPTCTLLVHPEDAARLGLEQGALARLSSRAGSLQVPVELTDGILRGVVSLPHGWGHDQPDTRLSVASERPGVNSNILADELDLEPLSGNAVLNGIPVTIEAI